MGAPIVYRFDDTNAPVLNNSAGSIVDILTACLVDGYGDKDAAGWSKPFENAGDTIACFTNNPVTGSGMTIRVDHSVGTTPVVQAYETMSDVDNGLGPFHNYQIYISPGNSAVAKQWVVIADDRIFYYFPFYDLDASEGWDWFNSNKTTAKLAKPLVFGDIISLLDPDPYAVVLAGSYTSNTSYGSDWVATWNIDSGSSNQRMWLCRGILGLPGVVITQVIHSGSPITVAGNQGSVSNTSFPRSTSLDLYTPAYIRDDGANTLRGLMPGAHHPCHSRIYYDHLVPVTIGGKTLLPVYTQGSAAGSAAQVCLLMDVSADFRP